MMKTINRKSPLPLNYQLARNIESGIVGKRWKIGDKLPPVRTLIKDYGVSLPVVRQALKQLEESGLIETIHGKGSFVRKGPNGAAGEGLSKITLIMKSRDELQRHYFMKVLSEVENNAAQKGISVEFAQVSSLADNGRFITPDANSAYILCGDVGAEIISEVKSSDSPAVMIGTDSEDADIVSISNDDFLGGYVAVKHLLALGHRKIGVFQRDGNALFSRQRLAGCRKALEEAGISEVQVWECMGRDQEKAAEEILKSPERPTAIFACSDRLAHSLIKASTSLDVSIPEDLSIVGFDDDAFAQFLVPALTTIRIDCEQLGSECIRILEDLCSGNDSGKKVKIAVSLIERESCCKPATNSDVDRTRKRAFTIVELLVVVAIITALAAMLLPALQKVMAVTRLTACSSNLKQIGLGLLLYAEDNNYSLPSPSGDGTHRWTSITLPYINVDAPSINALPKSIMCPSYYTGNIYCYGMNYTFSGRISKLPPLGISNTILVGDVYSSFYLYPNRWTKNYRFRHIDEENNRGILNGVHGDGHVSGYDYYEGKIFTPHENCPALNANKAH
ncbi:MAG: substrate-binding domain-containing protein [Planctomycetes bacterium]|nr:substrate-binding domain-containing protein [Planctomycetota bacterium]